MNLTNKRLQQIKVFSFDSIFCVIDNICEEKNCLAKHSRVKTFSIALWHDPVVPQCKQRVTFYF